MTHLSRKEFLERLSSHLFPISFIAACWEGGAAATSTLDPYSDIDLRLLVADGHIEQAFLEVEKFLESLSPIIQRRREPEPTWHGHSHNFYRLRDFSEHFVLDLIVMKESSLQRYTDTERHGSPIIYFDKKSCIQATSSDTEKFKKERIKKLADAIAFFPFLKAVTLKSVYRNKPLDAYARYQTLLNSLVEVWGMKYRPLRYDFGFRYAHSDFPKEIQVKLEAFCYLPHLQKLEENVHEIERCFFETTKELSRV